MELIGGGSRWWRRWFECDGGWYPQAKDVRRALAAVRSSLSRQDHRRLTASSLASTKTLVFSSFGILVFPNIRVNAFPQTHEPSESPSYFVYISQHESLILRPNWQVEAVRPRSLCFGLLLEAATRTTPHGNTIPEATKTQDGDSQFSYSRHVCIHCLYCLSNGTF
jgi:hypothetical protein